MCTTLPPVLVTVLGIEKLVPTFADLEVFLQLLPRSSTGERMNPYTSLWTGTTAGDGPQELHVVLLDNGRTRVLAGRGRPRRPPLHPLQRLPERLPRLLAHRRPRLRLGLPRADRRDPDAAAASGSRTPPSLPFASSLCGACYEVCPVKIDIPRVLLHLRAQAVRARSAPGERLVMRAAAWMFGSRSRFVLAQHVGRVAQRAVVRRSVIRRVPPPLAAWTRTRDLQPLARESFRAWWRRR